jgi:hypothetical protein
MARMGMEVVVSRQQDIDWPALLATLQANQLPALVAMIDGALQMPGAIPPSTWRDVRLRTPAGTITLVRKPAGIAVVVFSNADEASLTAQRVIADALRETP